MDGLTQFHRNDRIYFKMTDDSHIQTIVTNCYYGDDIK